ncbi:MAG: hypothetical protein J5I98_12660, partial [Phaeodactylibacter sp.]|nr:hypothetical protein [Phaeodactylibacter sp.]
WTQSTPRRHRATQRPDYQWKKLRVLCVDLSALCVQNHFVQWCGQAQSPVFWGPDHVFGAGERFLFQELAEMSAEEAPRAVAEAYFQRGMEAMEKFFSTRNPKEGLLLKLTEEDFETLYDAFGREAESLPYRMIRGMELAQEIYLHWFEGRYYLNNAVRGALMKENFRR